MGVVDQRQAIRKSYHQLFVLIGRRDGFACRTCHHPSNDLQIDHIMPVSKGGTNDPSNLQLLCLRCNGKKGAKLIGARPIDPLASGVFHPTDPALTTHWSLSYDRHRSRNNFAFVGVLCVYGIIVSGLMVYYPAAFHAHIALPHILLMVLGGLMALMIAALVLKAYRVARSA